MLYPFENPRMTVILIQSVCMGADPDASLAVLFNSCNKICADGVWILWIVVEEFNLLCIAGLTDASQTGCCSDPKVTAAVFQQCADAPGICLTPFGKVNQFQLIIGIDLI